MTVKKPQDRKPKKLDLAMRNRPTKGVELCLDMSLRAEWERADVDLREARKDATVDQRLSGGPVTELAKRVQELEAAMQDATVVFRLEGLTHIEWSRLRTEHPPRKDDAGDRTLGFNEATLFDEAIPLSVKGVTGPDGEDVEWSPDAWQALADEMTNRQYEDFKIAVLELNQLGGSRLPKSQAASLVMARSVAS